MERTKPTRERWSFTRNGQHFILRFKGSGIFFAYVKIDVRFVMKAIKSIWAQCGSKKGNVMGITYAAIVLDPGGVISWLVVGLIAGWLAGVVMKGGGYGMLGDIIVGLIGAFLGGMLMGMFANGTGGFIGSIFVAFIGACVLIFLLRAVSGRRAVA
jgi:uncharacterized membrane protein YeaQ/YmgE (transglycosylase-associated protein family)